MDLNNTGKTIAKLRRSAGFTQASLAEKLGISDKAISKWERGITFPDTSLLNQLCILLDTDIESIMYGHEQTNQWIGVLVLNDIIPAETIIYNKTMIEYLISQFLLVGIKNIEIIGKCKPMQIEGINLTISSEINHKFTKNVFIIYGNQFIYGPNLTKHFLRAMSRDTVTVIAAMKAKGEYPLLVDSDKKGMLSKGNVSKYYALPYIFDSRNKELHPFEKIIQQTVNVETMVRGMVCFNLDSYEMVYQMAGFIKMMEENTGEKIADIADIIVRRRININ
ncbi:helix-turn-helix transcriptional regulator [uncultured Eubacterium sp.]|uniref:helix-turn-helix domain-containing protein n=1 Tax=uncultured Eubacterium sp. TaxID=165185 RepID=UPI0025DCDC96|nr:helix-turn-helix transcriptional regulator [uncultured Eubacterium sp.]